MGKEVVCIRILEIWQHELEKKYIIFETKNKFFRTCGKKSEDEKLPSSTHS